MQVSWIRPAAPDVKIFELVSADGRALPSPEPGAHIDVHVAPGMVRQYSLCNGTDDRLGYIIAVRRNSTSSGASRTLHDKMAPGDHLVISEPRNHFGLRRDAARHVLVAQGIGIAPIVSMAKTLAAEQADFSLDYFARSDDHVCFRADLEAPGLAVRTRLHCGLDAEQQVEQLRRRFAQGSDGAHLYLCGGREFMQLALAVAKAWPADSRHCEYFHADPAAWAGERRSFCVRLARRGLSVDVPSDLSLAAALQKAGVAIHAPCGQGVCGECAVGVLAGRPDHRDAILTALERERDDSIITCVSRALGAELTLDL